MQAFNIYEWLRNSSTINVANVVISFLHTLAAVIDEDYSNDCAEGGPSVYDPKGEAQELVRLLHRASYEINVSGLCDSGKFEL